MRAQIFLASATRAARVVVAAGATLGDAVGSSGGLVASLSDATEPPQPARNTRRTRSHGRRIPFGSDAGSRTAIPRSSQSSRAGATGSRFYDPTMVPVGLTQYYTATTLDGFIADPDNSLDWLFTRNQDRDGPLNYAEFIADVGALAMGSTTYEWILDHEFKGKDPSEWKWPYDMPCWVFTHRELTVVPDAKVEFTSEDVSTVHEKMVAAASGKIWIVGGGD